MEWYSVADTSFLPALRFLNILMYVLVAKHRQEGASALSILHTNYGGAH